MDDQHGSLWPHGPKGASLESRLKGSLQHLEPQPPLPTGPLTCETLREELRFFAQEGALKRQLADVETRLREKMRAELQDMLNELRDCQVATLGPLVGIPESGEEDLPARSNPPARKEVNFNMRSYNAMSEVREFEEEQKEHIMPYRHHGHGHGHGHKRKSLLAVFPESIVPQNFKADGKLLHGDGDRERPCDALPAQLNLPGDVQSGNPQVDAQSDRKVTTIIATSDEIVPFGQSIMASTGIEEPAALESSSLKEWDKVPTVWSNVPTVEGNYDLDIAEDPPPDQLQPNLLEQSSKSDIDSASEDEMSNTSGTCCPWSRRSSFAIVHSGWFDYAIGIAILANAVQIGVQTDFNARHRGETPPVIFRVLECFFCALFTFELVLRLLSESTRFFCMKGWKWNLFDMLVVLIQLLEEVMAVATSAVSSSSSDSSNSPGLNLSFLRVLRVLRLVRIIRLVRILRLIGELRTLIMSILSSLKSLGWTIMLLFLVIFFFSVYFTQVVAEHEGDAHSELYKYYGTLDSTILALFQSITGGVDWQAVVEPLMETLSPWYAVIFSFYIAFSVLAVLNVVTGVFVESALLSAKSDQDFFMINNVRELFELVTWDRAEGLGKRADELAMTWEDFRSKIHSQQMRDYFKSIDVDPSDAYGIFHLLDADGSGSVSFEEFVSGCCRLRGSAKAIDVHILLYELRRLTDKVDSNGRELESFARVKKMAQQLPEPLRDRSSKHRDQISVIVQEGVSSSDTASSMLKANENSFQLTPLTCDDVEDVLLGGEGSGSRKSETKKVVVQHQSVELERDCRPKISAARSHKTVGSFFNKSS